jgi:hypothetical protein
MPYFPWEQAFTLLSKKYPHGIFLPPCGKFSPYFLFG